jgi:hypothetical protein
MTLIALINWQNVKACFDGRALAQSACGQVGFLVLAILAIPSYLCTFLIQFPNVIPSRMDISAAKNAHAMLRQN